MGKGILSLRICQPWMCQVTGWKAEPFTTSVTSGEVSSCSLQIQNTGVCHPIFCTGPCCSGLSENGVYHGRPPQKNGRKLLGKWWRTTGFSSFPPENVQTKSLLIFLDPHRFPDFWGVNFIQGLPVLPSLTAKLFWANFGGGAPIKRTIIAHDWGMAPRILRVSFIPSVFVKIDWPFYAFWQLSTSFFCVQATLKACLDNRKLERNHHAQCDQFDHGRPVDRNFCGRSPRFWWTCEVLSHVFDI